MQSSIVVPLIIGTPVHSVHNFNLEFQVAIPFPYHLAELFHSTSSRMASFQAEIGSSPTDAAPVTTAEASTRSPWNSINDMLIQNRCWLCHNAFQRGKVKKVFMVSQLLDHYEKLHIEMTGDNPPESLPVYPVHMNRCYESFVRHGANMENVLKELQELEIAPWMSGLACCQSPECLAFYNLVVTTDVAKSLADIKQAMISSGAMGTGIECPPGCGCDSPWSFLT